MKIIFNDLIDGELEISLDERGKLSLFITERIPNQEERTAEAIFDTNALALINEAIDLILKNEKICSEK